jgi:hypothetical protein
MVCSWCRFAKHQQAASRTVRLGGTVLLMLKLVGGYLRGGIVLLMCALKQQLP